ncbi:MAG TPA: class I SAM-dependent methyltransferase [Anaerolineales bacterium]|nr:class I SAM-dependent methyltransferase [Anaerolineales bacterium]
MNWILPIVLLIVIGFLLDREIYFYEGVHLGPRVQAWLYDRWSKKYDEGKRASQLRDSEMLALPLLELLKDISEPLILDFATGTGRLSFALLSEPDFKGHIIALDLSLGMLEQATAKLHQFILRSEQGSKVASPGARVELLRHVALPLPFPNEAFDVVCCLEVLELFPDMDVPLAELTRVLRPGGILLTSRGTEESGRKARVKSKPVFTSILEKYGMLNIQITTWWKLFDRVLAQKTGMTNQAGAKTLSAVMKCGACGQTQWRQEAGALKCQNCGRALSITKEGIVLN